ncbi:MAG: PD40 domain-containing protein [Anaerolineae bacterium]|nr:PD40 domain-containing protein [Anaerolineae bacterium]
MSKQNTVRLVVAGVVVLTLALVAILGGATNIFGTVIKPETAFPSLANIRTDPDTTNARVANTVWQPVETSTQAVCSDWLAYHTDQQGNWDIFRLDGVRSGDLKSTNVTAGGTKDDLSPTRSPDGQWIAYASIRDGNWEIYVARADGTQTQRLTYNTWATEINPVWSPDGQAIVYESIRNGNWDLYLADVKTGEEKRLTSHPGNDANAFWSPDAQKLLFQSDRDDFSQIYELDVTTLVETRISDGSSEDFDPSYSPDGQRILFTSLVGEGGNNVINMANADGTNRLQITDATKNSINPVWSSDGALVAFQADFKTSTDIFVYDVAMGVQRQLTANSGHNFAPTWICDSSLLVFTSDTTGDTNLFVLEFTPNSSASELGAQKVTDIAKRLTSSAAADIYPQNSPSIERGSRHALLTSKSK